MGDKLIRQGRVFHVSFSQTDTRDNFQVMHLRFCQGGQISARDIGIRSDYFVRDAKMNDE